MFVLDTCCAAGVLNRVYERVGAHGPLPAMPLDRPGLPAVDRSGARCQLPTRREATPRYSAATRTTVTMSALVNDLLDEALHNRLGRRFASLGSAW